MKSKLFVWIVAYLFIVNTVAISIAIETDNELQRSFSSNIDLFGFFGSLLNYLGKLLTFNIEGFNPFMSFFIIYIPVLLLVAIIIEWIRG